MKKIKILISTLIIALLFTGCTKSPEEILSNAGDKMSALDNYHMAMNMEFEMSYEGSTMTMNIGVDSDIDEKNQTAHMKMSTSFFGIETNIESYTMTKDEKNITYTLQEDEWYKEEAEIEENDFNFNIFKDASNIEKLEDKEDTYKISLTEEQIKEILDNTGSETGTEDATIDTENVDVEVTIIDEYVTKMVLIVPMSATSEGVTLDSECTITIEFSKFNEIGDIVIPNDVIENAIDSKIYEVATYAESYISEIEWDVLLNEENITYTNTELEYDGPVPTKVEVDIVDGQVIDGVIEIEGYRATIVDGSVSDVVKIDQNMKKISFIALFCLCLFTGCGQDPNIVVKDAISKFDNLDNVSVNMDMNYKITSGQMSFESNIIIDQQVDYKNNTSRIKSNNFTFFGVPMNIDIYQKIENDKMFSYTKEDNLWLAEIKEHEIPVSLQFEDDPIKIFSGVTEYDTYKITVSKDNIIKMIESSNFDDIEINDEKIEMIITIKDEYIKTMDFSLNFSFIQEDVKYDMMIDCYFSFSNFNTTSDVVIPQNILEHSMSVNDYNSYVYAYNYLIAIEDYLYDFYDDMTFTDTSLEYEGPEPSILKIYIEDGYITDGVIEVDGYRFRIKDREIIEALKMSDNIQYIYQ